MSISVHSDTPQTGTLPRTAGDGVLSEEMGGGIRTRLFTKYVALFVAVVAVALLANGLFEVFFYYREHKAALIRVQHEQAEAAAAKISQFVKEIESQLGWTTQLPWPAVRQPDKTDQSSIEPRRFDALRLLRQVPAITELAQVDATGRERLRVSRLAMDAVDSGIDLSDDPKFTQAVAHKIYYGPVYFRRESEPYMTLALAGARKDAGVSIAEVNLKLIWDVVSQIKVGEHGHAYVVGPEGRLIAHPDISLVLRNTDLSGLAQVRAALAGGGAMPDALQEATNIQGQKVLTTSAPISPLGWTMFVELPVEEAYAALYASLERLAIVLLGASIFAVLAGIFLARRMVGPIQALRTGAMRIGGGDFAQRISIKTGDELEELANQFNHMGERLQESYADLEHKVEQRTAELRQSLDDLRAAQDRLVQTEKLASLGQLTAGIAHEIKNPLNFVNNFSSVSTELIDELNEVLQTATLDGKTKNEVDELTGMLRGNLEKVVQHGKRADSIVKNMLLHSRQGSGEHRATEVNAIVEESLNLAYHGARAERPSFNVTLERDLDPTAGMADIYPQEITRVFLNLISNGFYAAAKRKESAAEGFEPTLRAATKNLGGRVEIRIRDNGTGIPQEVREKMFNPFFTTKPAGEGTGLGLSMSHDIVVKQHGGTIAVNTEPGVFTEFIITLPRAMAAGGPSGGKT
ncbi:Signal transduction histidine kinase regulating C4-dicarboxylate transport system [Bradyrhizobium sp. Ghvi]|uniref:sensor histidine kinase n=1 Tax=Bradyrhizobium sp. Ghvi TaxID=1855319 RepID=UPI0008EE85B4|nr:ATP-binding protein [Bradyrhizobium sp. Ghvi]SFP02429.1 Signal transduction histidine kinase regulating C4-dicarboxylate transport system [Bradyrhizobium sp. Ghvi]